MSTLGRLWPLWVESGPSLLLLPPQPTPTKPKHDPHSDCCAQCPKDGVMLFHAVGWEGEEVGKRNTPDCHATYEKQALGRECPVLHENGAPKRIRTSGLCLRRATLYPAELWVRSGPSSDGLRFRQPGPGAFRFASAKSTSCCSA